MVNILLSFALFGLFVLLPIIPASLLYRWFPDTKVSAKGVLSKFTINSSGAFAAYLVTVLVGYFVVAPINEAILGLVKAPSGVWTVRGNLQLQDNQGIRIEETNLYDSLSFEFNPEFLVHKNGNMELKIPELEAGVIPRYLITVNVDGFGQKTLSLSKLIDNADVEVDAKQHLIKLKAPVIVKTVNVPNRPYTGGEYINQ
jgi:hypothetical protein